MKARLVTNWGGAFVADVDLGLFIGYPDVVVWGTRVFVRDADLCSSMSPNIYREASVAFASAGAV